MSFPPPSSSRVDLKKSTTPVNMVTLANDHPGWGTLDAHLNTPWFDSLRATYGKKK